MRRLIIVLTVIVGCGLAGLQANSRVRVTVFASGLNDPRGLAFGPDGALYVAEAGAGGGTLSTIGQCQQVQPPVGPNTGGFTGRITRINRWGRQSVVADGLPSTEASPVVGGDKMGVADVMFAGGRLLALVNGAGCSHGHLHAPNAVIAMNGDGQWSEVANLSAWLLANPGLKGAELPLAPDYEPDGTWYAMQRAWGRLLAIEPNHGLLVNVRPSGRVDLVTDLLEKFGDNTYTAMAVKDDDLYIGTLGRIAFVPDLFPPVPDLDASFEGAVYKLSSQGKGRLYASGLKAVLGLVFDRRERLYALQSPIFVPGTGSLVRVNPRGEHEVIVAGLTFPSSLTLGPDGDFYVSACGYHCAPGDGQILRISVP